jgi:hypothetical protein
MKKKHNLEKKSVERFLRKSIQLKFPLFYFTKGQLIEFLGFYEKLTS